ncbi:hypothetical protein MPSEU_000080900 [Mayamaea pseudoterrestris]|nr:hypothetical protein MPSEU_000080900 [Mayamaea pseudoterrestris]
MKLFICIILVIESRAFQTMGHQKRLVKRLLSSSSAATDVLPPRNNNILPEAHAMEEWLQRSSPSAIWNRNVKHARFENGLRGLLWTGQLPMEQGTKIVSIPATKTIQVDTDSPDWDARLAIKLLDEKKKGDRSSFYTYIQHITESKSLQLAPTAPHALRHWTLDQRQLLAGESTGMKLLLLHEEQQQAWRRKYATYGAAEPVTYEEFSWAMEAVHSRAFRGQQSVNNMDAAISVLAPLAAAVVGYIYLDSNSDPSMSLLGSLAGVAAMPMIVSKLKEHRQNICLLPFIDSANHSEQADSQIDYDPLTDSFQLLVGPNCVNVTTRQLYISYGPRSDADLMLNHGFLPGVNLDYSCSDSYTAALACEYIRRNT